MSNSDWNLQDWFNGALDTLKNYFQPSDAPAPTPPEDTSYNPPAPPQDNGFQMPDIVGGIQQGAQSLSSWINEQVGGFQAPDVPPEFERGFDMAAPGLRQSLEAIPGIPQGLGDMAGGFIRGAQAPFERVVSGNEDTASFQRAGDYLAQVGRIPIDTSQPFAESGQPEALAAIGSAIGEASRAAEQLPVVGLIPRALEGAVGGLAGGVGTAMQRYQTGVIEPERAAATKHSLAKTGATPAGLYYQLTGGVPTFGLEDTAARMNAATNELKTLRATAAPDVLAKVDAYLQEHGYDRPDAALAGAKAVAGGMDIKEAGNRYGDIAGDLVGQVIADPLNFIDVPFKAIGLLKPVSKAVRLDVHAVYDADLARSMGKTLLGSEEAARAKAASYGFKGRVEQFTEQLTKLSPHSAQDHYLGQAEAVAQSVLHGNPGGPEAAGRLGAFISGDYEKAARFPGDTLPDDLRRLGESDAGMNTRMIVNEMMKDAEGNVDKDMLAKLIGDKEKPDALRAIAGQMEKALKVIIPDAPDSTAGKVFSRLHDIAARAFIGGSPGAIVRNAIGNESTMLIDGLMPREDIAAIQKAFADRGLSIASMVGGGVGTGKNAELGIAGAVKTDMELRDLTASLRANVFPNSARGPFKSVVSALTGESGLAAYGDLEKSARARAAFKGMMDAERYYAPRLVDTVIANLNAQKNLGEVAVLLRGTITDLSPSTIRTAIGKARKLVDSKGYVPANVAHLETEAGKAALRELKVSGYGDLVDRINQAYHDFPNDPAKRTAALEAVVKEVEAKLAKHAAAEEALLKAERATAKAEAAPKPAEGIPSAPAAKAAVAKEAEKEIKAAGDIYEAARERVWKDLDAAGHSAETLVSTQYDPVHASAWQDYWNLRDRVFADGKRPPNGSPLWDEWFKDGKRLARQGLAVDLARADQLHALANPLAEKPSVKFAKQFEQFGGRPLKEKDFADAAKWMEQHGFDAPQVVKARPLTVAEEAQTARVATEAKAAPANRTTEEISAEMTRVLNAKETKQFTAEDKFNRIAELEQERQAAITRRGAEYDAQLAAEQAAKAAQPGTPPVEPAPVAEAAGQGAEGGKVASEVAAQAKPALVKPFTRAEFETQLRSAAQAAGIPDAQVDATLALHDALAKTVANLTGKGEGEYFRRLAGVSLDVPERNPLFQSVQAAPTFYLKSQKVVDAIPQEKMSVEQLRAALTKGGVKADEMKWTGLDDFLASKKGAITRQEVRDVLAANDVQVREITKGGKGFVDDGIGGNLAATKYSHYTLPGGENYRELLLTLPASNKERNALFAEQAAIQSKIQAAFDADLELQRLRAQVQDAQQAFDKTQRVGTSDAYTQARQARKLAEDAYQASLDSKFSNEYDRLTAITQQLNNPPKYTSPHWDEPNVLAHVRFDDRVDAAGKRTLFIEEVQSDWHQAGKAKGYQAEPSKVAALQKELAAAEQAYADLDISGMTREQLRTNPVYRRMTDLRDQMIATERGVPTAPFSKSWPELSMKRMLKYASENGYDQIAWTTGAQQAERYDLAKQVDAIRISGDPAQGLVIEAARPRQGYEVIASDVPANKLADHVGKDIAEKFATGQTEFKGVDLKVGGEGMKGFYDKILPDTMNGLAKKWGARVGEARISDSTLGGNWRDKFVVRDNGRAGSTNDRFTVLANGNWWGDFKTREEADAAIAKVGDRIMKPAHSLPVTPAMRKSVLEEGQPLFQADAAFKKAATTFTDDGRALLHIFDGMAQGTVKSDVSSLAHESAHIFRKVMGDVAAETGAKQLTADMEYALRWASDGRNTWDTAAEEKFALGFERYLKDGHIEGVSERVHAVYEQFKQWLLEIYANLSMNDKLPDVPEGMQRVFKTWLDGYPEYNQQAALGRIRKAAAQKGIGTEKTDTRLLAALNDHGGYAANGVLHPDRFTKENLAARENEAAGILSSYVSTSHIPKETRDFLRSQGVTDADLAKMPRKDAVELAKAMKADATQAAQEAAYKAQATAEVNRELRQNGRMLKADQIDQFFKPNPSHTTAVEGRTVWATRDGKWLPNGDPANGIMGTRFAKPTRTKPGPEWKLVPGHEVAGWRDAVSEQLTGDPSNWAEVERMVVDSRRANAELNQTRKAAKTQSAMFTGGEDLPLQSGVAQKAQAQAFKPPEVGQQERMFSTAPEMGQNAPKASSEPVEALQGVAEQEPWQMTRTDYLNQRLELSRKPREVTVVTPNGNVRTTYEEALANGLITKKQFDKERWSGLSQKQSERADALAAGRNHEYYVSQALKQGKPVPPDVVNEYQLLKDKGNAALYQTVPAPTPEDYHRAFDELIRAVESGDEAAIQKATEKWGELIGHAEINSQARAGKIDAETYKQLMADLAKGKRPVMDGATRTLPEEYTFWGERIRRATDAITSELDGVKPIGVSPRLTHGLVNELEKQLLSGAERMRFFAQREGVERMNFALLSGERKNFDTILSAFFPFHYWYTRSYANWARRLVDNPRLLAGYMALNRTLEEVNRELPPQYRHNVPVDLMGTRHYWDWEQTLNPLRNLVDDFSVSEREPDALGRLINQTGNMGPGLWQFIPWMYALASGDKQTGQAYFNYLTPQTRALRAATALLKEKGVNTIGPVQIPQGGIYLEDAIFRAAGVVGTGDMWEQRRIGKAMADLIGKPNPETGQPITATDTMRASYQQSGAVWEMARQKAIADQAGGTLLSFGGVAGLKARPASLIEVEKAQDEYYKLNDAFFSARTLTDAEYSQKIHDFYDKYPWFTDVKMARSSDAERNSLFFTDVLNRIPPGQRTKSYTASGVSDLIDQYFKVKGGAVVPPKPLNPAEEAIYAALGGKPGPHTLSTTEAKAAWLENLQATRPDAYKRFVNAMEGLDKQFTIPSGETRNEWDRVSAMYKDEYANITDPRAREAYKQAHPDFAKYYPDTDTERFWNSYYSLDPIGQKMLRESPAMKALGGDVYMDKGTRNLLTEEAKANLADTVEAFAARIKQLPAYRQYTDTVQAQFGGQAIYDKQDQYYAIPDTDKAGRQAYLKANPDLKAFWQWKDAYLIRFPELGAALANKGVAPSNTGYAASTVNGGYQTRINSAAAEIQREIGPYFIAFAQKGGGAAPLSKPALKVVAAAQQKYAPTVHPYRFIQDVLKAMKLQPFYKYQQAPPVPGYGSRTTARYLTPFSRR